MTKMYAKLCISVDYVEVEEIDNRIVMTTHYRDRTLPRVDTGRDVLDRLQILSALYLQQTSVVALVAVEVERRLEEADAK